MRCGKPMAILARTGRSAAIAVAVLFIGLSVGGIVAIWCVHQRVTSVALKTFSMVETAAGIADAGVVRVKDLVATCQGEVRQASESLATVGARVDMNRPVLIALRERLETRLLPRTAQMEQALAPVRDAVIRMNDVVSLVNSLPMMADRAPRLDALEEILSRLEALSGDATQLRGTLLALVAEQKSDLAPETVTTLIGLAHRIDGSLEQVQVSLSGMQEAISGFRLRQNARESRVLFLFNAASALSSLMLIWIGYSQMVVIRHYRMQERFPAGSGT
jgi:hypothetical protein